MTRALVICGPTSSGKSEIALAIAEQLGGEIVNADSRQIYRGMSIGTGMPSQTAFERIQHHLYGFVDPGQRYSAARYTHDADAAISAIAARGRLPVVVGGTGFYIEALVGTMPLDRPPGDEVLRERLRREAQMHPPDVLWEWLSVLSPDRAASTRRSDPYRILRALESALIERTEIETSEHAPQRPKLEYVIAVLQLPRSVLRTRITQRVHEMFALGLVNEAQAVRAYTADAPALSGLGYAEALTMLDGLTTPA
ncbi:MAG TPA: tRNA (adenosine(37)-N6)-dimethylallyltransferase MiaA, partial [Candidatus Eremiobacteraceae bacterium]|nr:tRNA (adenosine(37)-N6)-dimethylallyltransferase MiaA [Candidatus Eremiobacteraceae bacterium]